MCNHNEGDCWRVRARRDHYTNEFVARRLTSFEAANLGLILKHNRTKPDLVDHVQDIMGNLLITKDSCPTPSQVYCKTFVIHCSLCMWLLIFFYKMSPPADSWLFFPTMTLQTRPGTTTVAGLTTHPITTPTNTHLEIPFHPNINNSLSSGKYTCLLTPSQLGFAMRKGPFLTNSGHNNIPNTQRLPLTNKYMFAPWAENGPQTIVV